MTVSNGVVSPLYTEKGRRINRYPAPAGFYADARTGPQPIERIQNLAMRYGWVPNELPDLQTFRRDPRARRLAVRKMLSDEAVKGGLLEKVFGVGQLTLQS